MNWFENMGPKAVEIFNANTVGFFAAANAWAGRQTLGDVTRVEEAVQSGLHTLSVFDPNADPQHFELEELLRCFVSDISRGDVLAVTTMAEVISERYRKAVSDVAETVREVREEKRVQVAAARAERDDARAKREIAEATAKSLAKRCGAVEERARKAEERAKAAEADLAAARGHLSHSRGYAKSLEDRLKGGGDVARILEELATRVVALEARSA